MHADSRDFLLDPTPPLHRDHDMATPVMARALHIGGTPWCGPRRQTAGAVIINMPWIELGGTKFVRPGLDGRVHHVPGAGQCAFGAQN